MKLRTEKWIGWALLTVGLTALVLTLVMVQPGPVAGAGATSQAGPTGSTMLPWGFTSSPSPSKYSDLFGVSCSSPTFCAAVGYQVNGAPNQPIYQTLMEAWDGNSWSVIPSPNPGTLENRPTRVSCTGPSFCVAVGYYSSYVGTLNLVETWDGTSWVVTPVPNPAKYTALSGVSCISPTDCIAVGNYNDPNGPIHSLVEAWDGSAWWVVPSPNPATGINVLSGVSCTSPTSCMAVGSSSNDTSGASCNSLVESWDGSNWEVVPTPDPGGASPLLGDAPALARPTSAWRSAPLHSPVSNRPCRSASTGTETPGP